MSKGTHGEKLLSHRPLSIPNSSPSSPPAQQPHNPSRPRSHLPAQQAAPRYTISRRIQIVRAQRRLRDRIRDIPNRQRPTGHIRRRAVERHRTRRDVPPGNGAVKHLVHRIWLVRRQPVAGLQDAREREVPLLADVAAGRGAAACEEGGVPCCLEGEGGGVGEG